MMESASDRQLIPINMTRSLARLLKQSSRPPTATSELSSLGKGVEITIAIASAVMTSLQFQHVRKVSVFCHRQKCVAIFTSDH